jgi:predicted ATPase/DNA-binding SARP family transcriptional activator
MNDGLRLKTLGNVAIILNGQYLTEQLPLKTRALLIYLASVRQPVPREILAELFWADSTPDTARGSLRVALVPLRKLIDPYLESTRDELSVVNIWLDVTQFNAALRKLQQDLTSKQITSESITELESALQLYQGEFLENFSVSASPTFETWVEAERTMLRSQFVSAAGVLIDWCIDHQRFDVPIALESRLLAADPLNENTYRRLMRLHAASGNRITALRLFETFQNTLWDELGVEPEDETIQLYESLARTPARASISSPHELPPEAQTHAPIRHNIPQQLTPLVGRETEIELLLSRLRVSRLVTVTGMGGSGKTRLALAVAERAVTDKAFESIYFAGLAPLRAADQVGSTLSRVLGLPEHADADHNEAITHALADKRSLLVLDNFEHVLGAAELVNHLLRSIPGLRVLTTSREPLHLYGEYCYNTPLLDPADAAALFMDRALAVNPEFPLDEATLQRVDILCSRLEYLPLAIELAASRASTLTVERMLTMLAQPFKFLATNWRGLPERQRTLQSTLEWSYNLLGSEEQSLLRSLSVFSDGFTDSAVEAVCGQLAEHLTSLLNKSLLRREATIVEIPHYAMLDMIRVFAAGKLTDSAEIARLHEAHTRYYVDFAQQAAHNSRIQDADEWRLQLHAQINNFYLVFERLYVSENAEDECRLVGALNDYWYRRGYYREAHHYASKALRHRNHISPRLLAGVLTTLGEALHGMGRMDEAEYHHAEAKILYEQLGDKQHVAYIAFCQSLRAHNLSQSRELAESGLQIARALNDKHLIGLLLVSLGNNYSLSGGSQYAITLFTEALECLIGIDTYVLAFALLSRAIALVNHEDVEAALVDLQKAFSTPASNDAAAFTILSALLGDIYFILGDPEEAWFSYQQGVKWAQERNDTRRLRYLYRLGALIAAFRNDSSLMQHLYTQAFENVHATDISTSDLMQVLPGAAHIAYWLAEHGRLMEAVMIDNAIGRLLISRAVAPNYLTRHYRTELAALLNSVDIQAFGEVEDIPEQDLFKFMLQQLGLVLGA